MKPTVELQGMAELRKKLRAIPQDLQKKGFRSAMRKAANLVRDAAKANAGEVDDPETGERIADNVAVRFSPKEYKRDGDIVFRVGILGGARAYANTKDNVRKRRVGKLYAPSGNLVGGQPGGDTWYWRLVEFGTSKMAARPFLRPALSQNASAATDAAVAAMNKEIDKAVRKVGGKA